jgi:1-acyl-sn-glycerol-3-phosphate acyltransferase
MIRTVLTALTLFIFTLICGIAVIIFGVFNPYSKIIYYISYIWSKSILFVAGTKLKVYGLDNIDSEKNYIFIANHQSHFDVLAVFNILPLTVRFLAKKELFRIPLFGWAIAAVGMIKIDRSNREKALQSMEEAQQIINKGVSVVVFPEGTRSFDGKIQKFKKGGFVIALKCRIPIVPVSISGSRFILKKHTLRIEPGIIKIVIDQPIETGSYSYEQRDQLAEHVKKVIKKNIDDAFNERIVE